MQAAGRWILRLDEFKNTLSQAARISLATGCSGSCRLMSNFMVNSVDATFGRQDNDPGRDLDLRVW